MNTSLAVNLQPDYLDSQELRVMTKPIEIEWIRTDEAASLLGVKSTQGVLHIVRGDPNKPNWIVGYLNVGTDKKPRYMLNKADVVQLANERKNQTNL